MAEAGVVKAEERRVGNARYQPRSDKNPVPGGTGFLCLGCSNSLMTSCIFRLVRPRPLFADLRHYSSDNKYVTVASGKGDVSKDIMVDVFKDWL